MKSPISRSSSLSAGLEWRCNQVDILAPFRAGISKAGLF